MSRVLLVAADKSLPLCSHCEIRTKTVVVEGTAHTISFPRGFQISEHSYYRDCVNHFGYPIKPFQYELDLDAEETDLLHLKDYLRENFLFGDKVELWSIWVSDFPGRKQIRIHKSLSELDLSCLEQLLQADDLCITVTI